MGWDVRYHIADYAEKVKMVAVQTLSDLSRDDCTHFDLLWSNKFALKPVKRG